MGLGNASQHPSKCPSVPHMQPIVGAASPMLTSPGPSPVDRVVIHSGPIVGALSRGCNLTLTFRSTGVNGFGLNGCSATRPVPLQGGGRRNAESEWESGVVGGYKQLNLQNSPHFAPRNSMIINPLSGVPTPGPESDHLHPLLLRACRRPTGGTLSGVTEQVVG